MAGATRYDSLARRTGIRKSIEEAETGMASWPPYMRKDTVVVKLRWTGGCDTVTVPGQGPALLVGAHLLAKGIVLRQSAGAGRRRRDQLASSVRTFCQRE